jgi:predicted transcriptional regulator
MKLFEIIEIEKDNNIKKHIPYGYYLNYDQAKKIMRELNLKIKKNLNKISKKSHKSLACVDELRIFLDIYFVISKLFCTFVI